MSKRIKYTLYMQVHNPGEKNVDVLVRLHRCISSLCFRGLSSTEIWLFRWRRRSIGTKNKAVRLGAYHED